MCSVKALKLKSWGLGAHCTGVARKCHSSRSITSTSGGSTLEQGCQFWLCFAPPFGMMQQKVVTMNNITSLYRLKQLTRESEICWHCN